MFGITYMSEEEVKNLQVPNNTQSIIIDREQPIFYIKSKDAFGNESIKYFKFEEIKAPEPPHYVTREELEELLKKYVGGNSDEQVH